MRPWVWQIELDKDNLITRCQLPFMLAWAVTIHKVRSLHLDPESEVDPCAVPSLDAGCRHVQPSGRMGRWAVICLS